MSEGRNRPSPLILFMRKLSANDQLVLTLVAIVLGAVSGAFAIGFVELIDVFQKLFFQISGPHIADYIASLPAWKVVLTPALGGLIVGFLIYHVMSDQRPKGPADVIGACETGPAKMSMKDGLVAALASALSLGAGASVGREGPVIHLGGSLGSWLAAKLQMSKSNARIFLGCGVAAAISASFNAPIAGALFAQEVILSHYALKAFAPVVIASVAGTVVAHQWVGNVTAFSLPAYELGSYLEFPAFAGLGVISGLSAILFVWSILFLQRHVQRLPVIPWVRPAIGGLIIGFIALYYPEVLGVGYEATENALKGQYVFAILLGLFVFKFLATVISHGFGFSGGVFSPALVVGAMLGGVYGLGVGEFFPNLFSGASAYSLIGMAAMSAAVLGAPISTTIIIFELTGDYTMTIAVMCACVLATLVNDQMGRQSFFLEQLKSRGIDVMNNFANLLLRQMKVSDVLKREGLTVPMDASLAQVRHLMMRASGGLVYVLTPDRCLYGTIGWDNMPEEMFDHHLDRLILAVDLADRKPAVLEKNDTLDVAHSIFEEASVSQIPVVDPDQGRIFIGCVDEREVIAAYNDELIKRRHQEQGTA